MKRIDVLCLRNDTHLNPGAEVLHPSPGLGGDAVSWPTPVVKNSALCHLTFPSLPVQMSDFHGRKSLYNAFLPVLVFVLLALQPEHVGHGLVRGS